jgi:hypothetical protein
VRTFENDCLEHKAQLWDGLLVFLGAGGRGVLGRGLRGKGDTCPQIQCKMTITADRMTVISLIDVGL